MRLAFVLCLSATLTRLLFAAPQSTIPATEDYSGLYSFLRDGEFIQITIEEKGQVTGFISRYGDSVSDKGTFLDQFFKSGRFDAEKLSFTTENVHGTWFTFEGVFGRGSGKKPDDEGYYVVRGKLTRFSTNAGSETTSQVQQVEFKSFPRDAAAN